MDIETPSGLDTSVCPVCGGQNQCAMATNSAAKSCWCENVEFPQELLDRVPDHALHQTCICRNCLDHFMIESKGAN